MNGAQAKRTQKKRRQTPPQRPAGALAAGAKRPKTHLERCSQARSKGFSALSGTIVHIVCDKGLHEEQLDPFYLTLLLVTFLVYLYTRRWEWVLVAFVVYYALENVLFFGAKVLHGHIGAYLHRHFSRTDELLTDPIVFALALLVAGYLLELSAFAVGAVPSGAARTLAVALVALLSVFSRLYTLSAGALLVTIWIVYATQSATAGALEQALVATVGTLFLYAWFVRPINSHYIFNALFCLLHAAFFAALFTGIALNV